MLNVEHLNVYYGESHVIRDLGLTVGERETVAIMGRNGMGKTTLLKTLIGMLPAQGGTIGFGNADVTHRKSYERVARGMAFVPQNRMIFPYLTVEENILTGMENARVKSVPDYIYSFFPVLAEMRRRRGGNLSGGQQQQLAIARGLVSEPKLLLLDEPTDGIQPSVIKEIARTLNRIKAERPLAILVSEQMLSFAVEIADRFFVMERGQFVYQSLRADLDRHKVHSYLTI